MKQYAGWKRDLMPMLPVKIAKMLEQIDENAPIEEVRLRAGQPIELRYGGGGRLIYDMGKLPAVSLADCEEVFARVCGHSVYAWEDEIKNGFITLEGGYRVGLAGRIVRDESGHVLRMTDISSLNIRIARAVEGAADAVIKYLLRPDGTPYSTLIISPPGIGKTTMLRDAVRQLSYGMGGACASRVCVVDERMELSGSVRGMAQHDIGPRTDVLTGCSKPEGIRMAVRTLSPDVIATDELGSMEDAEAVLEASFCGVSTIATAHVTDITALRARGTLTRLLKGSVIERIVELKRTGMQVGCIGGVYDGECQAIQKGGGALCFGLSRY